jgi:hypothetical protein
MPEASMVRGNHSASQKNGHPEWVVLVIRLFLPRPIVPLQAATPARGAGEGRVEMRHMVKVRVALMVVLIGLSGAGLVFGQDSDPCHEAYLESGLSAQQMSFEEFRGVYGETVCATQVASLSESQSK